MTKQDYGTYIRQNTLPTDDPDALHEFAPVQGFKLMTRDEITDPTLLPLCFPGYVPMLLEYEEYGEEFELMARTPKMDADTFKMLAKAADEFRLAFKGVQLHARVEGRWPYVGFFVVNK